jgi:hypothetical protein
MVEGIVTNIVLSLLGTAGTYFLASAGRWFTGRMEGQRHEAKLKAMITIGVGVVTDTYKAWIAEAKRTGGRLTIEDIRKAFVESKGKFIAAMRERGIDVIVEYGEAWVDGFIEDLVKIAKADTPSHIDPAKQIPLTAMFGTEFQAKWEAKQAAIDPRTDAEGKQR